MRDVLVIRLNEDENLVIASDNSGSVGLKEMDAVKVPYDTTAYYSFRVAVMEVMSAGATPFAVTLHNFCGEEAWMDLLKGIEQGKVELDMMSIRVTGSTESNFSMNQSAVGITVLGKTRGTSGWEKMTFNSQTKIAVIGCPLVGQEVLYRDNEVVPLAVFKEIYGLDTVVTIPVGSKGILFELNGLFTNVQFKKEELNTDMDLMKSSGPSTCFIAIYPEAITDEMKSIAGGFFHEINYTG